MADLVISSLPVITSATTDDVIILNDSNSTTTQITFGNLLASAVYPGGSEASPSITFEGDVDTGMWSPAANTLAFSTAGSAALYIDSQGFIGINQDTPSDMNAGARDVVIGNTTDTLDHGITILTNPTGDSIINFADGTGLSAAAGQIVYSHDGNRLHIDTSGTQALAITDNQDIFIGTTTADQETRVAVSGGCISADDGSAAYPIFNFTNDLDSGFYRITTDKVAVSTGGVSRLIVDETGNLGIGTENPEADIHVNKGNANLIVTDSDAVGNPRAIVSAADGSLSVSADADNVTANSKISMSVDGTEIARLVATGEVVIPNKVVFNEATDDVTDPYARIGRDTSGSGEILIESDPSNLYANSGFRVSVDGTDALELDASGNLHYLSDANVYFGTDLDTFIVHPAPDTVQLYTGGNLAAAALDDASLLLSGLAKVDATNQKLLFGTVTPIAVSGVSSTFQLLGNAANKGISLQQYGTSSDAQVLEFYKDRGGPGTPLTANSSDTVGHISFKYTGGGSAGEAASIKTVITNIPGTTSTPGNLVFSTTPGSTTTPVEAFRLNSSGAAGFGGTNFGAVGEVLVSSGAGAPPVWSAPDVSSVNGQTGTIVLDTDDISDATATNKYITPAQVTKLDGIEAGATADQSPSEIKAFYESNADTNNLSDALLAKLQGIDTSANNLQVHLLPDLP